MGEAHACLWLSPRASLAQAPSLTENLCLASSAGKGPAFRSSLSFGSDPEEKEWERLRGDSNPGSCPRRLARKQGHAGPSLWAWNG